MDRRSIVQQLVGQIPWGHNIILLTKVKERAEREWYARAAIEYGWSRAVLVHQIESKLCQRQGKAVTNFAGQLPAPQSELAQMTLKDPYMFDFLGIGNEAHERDVENSLVEHITKFLLELGAGFSYVGRQIHLEIGGEDFYLDLLFYHLKLRCPEETVMAQYWFAGVHCDVGGGYKESGLADIALLWMVDQAEAAGLGFDRDYLADIADPDVLGKLHRSRRGLYWAKRAYLRPVGEFGALEKVHETVRQRMEKSNYHPPNINI